jgi:hypothetical protein
MSRTPTPYPLFVLVVLALAGVACSLTAPAPSQAALMPATHPSPTSKPTPSPTPTASPTPASGGRCVVVAYALNVRDCPGTGCAIIDGLTNGQTIDAVPAAADGWLVFPLADGRAGYIVARYCDFGE